MQHQKRLGLSRSELPLQGTEYWKMIRILREGSAPTDRRANEGFDFDALLTWQAFAHPFDVVGDIDLTTSEKRAILASWASDACAVEAAPAFRIGASGNAVSWEDIMDALKALDQPTRYSSAGKGTGRALQATPRLAQA